MSSDQVNITGEETTSPTDRARGWLVTVNNYTDADEEKVRNKDFDQEKIRYAVFNFEVAPTTLTPHLQGFVRFHKAVTFTSAKTILAFDAYPHFVLAKARRNDYEACYLYCTKNDRGGTGDFVEFGTRKTQQGKRNDITNAVSYIEEHIADNIPIDQLQMSLTHPGAVAKYSTFLTDVERGLIAKRTLDNWANQTQPLRPWQARVFELTQLPVDPRKIIFVLDPYGNAGKSYMCTYISFTYKDSTNTQVAHLTPGKVGDMVCALAKQSREPKIVMLDAPRAKNEHIQMPFVEEVKNGYILNSKFSSGQMRWPQPHVIVFANHLFKNGKEAPLSEDRWHCIHIKEDGCNFTESFEEPDMIEDKPDPY